jgi:FecR protein
LTYSSISKLLSSISKPLPALLAVSYASMAVARAEPTTVKIGEAEIIRNEVVSIDGAKASPIAVGDVVVRDEIVSTRANSDARFGLIDSTKLALGPNSTVKIDRAVYADDSRYKQIVIGLTEGSFRFVTGKSDKKSYKIETPTATIGVRGTILDILISENRTLVTLQDGQASVCAGKRCTQLLERGHTADVTRQGGAVQIRRDLVPTWTFASVCANHSQLCAPLPSVVKRANLPAPLARPKSKGFSDIRGCPDGQALVGDRCAPDPVRDTSLPRLNDVARDSSLPTLGAPIGQDLGAAGRLGTSPLGGGGGLSVPRLGR